MSEGGHTDFYELLGVAVTASEKEISKAYRQRALKVHPDKVGAENKVAAEMFLLLSKAVEVLTDAAKRAVYDEGHRAQLAKKERLEKLDSKRRQAREDLERREAEGIKRAKTDAFDEAEIKRLREEGLRRLAEMKRFEEQQSPLDRSNASSNAEGQDYTLSVKWKSAFASNVESLFSEYGKIETFVSSANARRAVIRYVKATDAEAVYSKRQLFPDFTIKWAISRDPVATEGTAKSGKAKTKPEETIANTITGSEFKKFENDILRKMQARANAAKINSS
ncbi:hypothetical protein HDU82_007075 [Entophlyctis luteolus]|nr:hypothetical protein HDU82_007075 [Entophlyctis luteolus]